MTEQTTRGLRTLIERGYLPGSGDDDPPAVIINPATTALGLIAACEIRAATLNNALDAWACSSDDAPGDARALAEVLLPTAEELKVLLEELSRRQRKAEK